MPKANDKGTKRKREESNNNSLKHINGESRNNEKMMNDKTNKQELPKKRFKEEKIEKSKQLLTKRKKSRQQLTSKNNEPRLCGNGKPMPSLAELEKMYEDSDEESPLMTNVIPSGLKTPPEPVKYEDTSISPKTLEVISSKVSEFISNLPDSTVIEESPPPSVIPPKKRKKDGLPYIVGATKRKQYLKKPKSVVGRGDTKYGVTYDNVECDNDICDNKQQRRKKSRIKENPTSIFNSKSNEIACFLKESENTEAHSDGSVDSNKTLTYDFNAASPINRYHSFSPIPSTSKDNETFLKNDMRFNESLLSDNSQSEIEVLEIPCETIIIDDYDVENNLNSCIQIADNDMEDTSYCSMPQYDIPPVVDYYNQFEINNTLSSDDCEIIDVDDVIAENRAIIEKYKGNNHEVMHIPPSYDEENSKLNTANMYLNNSSAKKEVRPNSKQNDITTIVKSFFNSYFQQNKNSNTNISSDAVLYQPEDIHQIHGSIQPALFKNILNCVIESAQILMSSFKKKVVNPSEIINIDSLNTSSNINCNDHSIIFVGTTLSDNNRPNNSVIHVSSSVPDIFLPTQSRSTKKKTKKSKTDLLKANNTFIEKTDSPARSIGDCPICMENLSNNTVASTKCGHIFCMKCIQAAIKTSGKKCPTCRSALKGTGYHPLFL